MVRCVMPMRLSSACPRLIASGFDAAIAVNSLHFPPVQSQFQKKGLGDTNVDYAECTHGLRWFVLTSTCNKLTNSKKKKNG